MAFNISVEEDIDRPLQFDCFLRSLLILKCLAPSWFWPSNSICNWDNHDGCCWCPDKLLFTRQVLTLTCPPSSVSVGCPWVITTVLQGIVLSLKGTTLSRRSHQDCLPKSGRLWFRGWVYKRPREGSGAPTPLFLPGESPEQGSLVGCIYGVTQSWTLLKRLSSSSSTQKAYPFGSGRDWLSEQSVLQCAPWGQAEARLQLGPQLAGLSPCPVCLPHSSPPENIAP